MIYLSIYLPTQNGFQAYEKVTLKLEHVEEQASKVMVTNKESKLAFERKEGPLLCCLAYACMPSLFFCRMSSNCLLHIPDEGSHKSTTDTTSWSNYSYSICDLMEIRDEWIGTRVID